MGRHEQFYATNAHFEKVMFTGRTAGGAGLSPDIWDDMPIANMAVDPTLGIFVMDNFAHLNTTGFPYLISGTNGTFVTRTGQAQGIARLATGGADNDEAYVSYNNNVSGLIRADATTDPFYDWCFEARVYVSQITLAQGVFVGLAEEAAVGADFMTDSTMALKVLDWIGFQIISATDIAAVWQTVMALNTGARVAVDATAGTPSVAWVKLGMKSVLGTVSFYINGAKLDTGVASTATNFPASQLLCPTFATKAGQGTANTLDVDWWAAAQLR